MSAFINLLLAYSDNSATTRLAISQFCQNVAQRTNNLVSVSALPDKQLGRPMNTLTDVMEGRVDMVIQPVDRWGMTIPKFGCLAAPFSFENHAHADHVFANEFEYWISPDLETLGLTYLASWEWGFRQISNAKRRVLKPDDMRCLKIRVPPSSIYRSTIFAFGGVPIVVEFDKLRKVISQGLVDGQENPFAIFDELELYGVQKYLSFLNYSYGTLGHLINKSQFDRLAPDQQNILREESLTAGQLMSSSLRTHEKVRTTELESLGIQVDRPDPAPFKLLLSSVYDEIGVLYGADNMSSFHALL